MNLRRVCPIGAPDFCPVQSKSCMLLGYVSRDLERRCGEKGELVGTVDRFVTAVANRRTTPDAIYPD